MGYGLHLFRFILCVMSGMWWKESRESSFPTGEKYNRPEELCGKRETGWKLCAGESRSWKIKLSQFGTLQLEVITHSNTHGLVNNYLYCSLISLSLKECCWNGWMLIKNGWEMILIHFKPCLVMCCVWNMCFGIVKAKQNKAMRYKT